MKHRILAFTAAVAICASCVELDYGVGSNLLPVKSLYDVCVSSMPMTDIDMAVSDSLSGYSSTRVTIGSIRDPELGLTKRSSVITLVPMNDSLNFGKNRVFKSFYINFCRDTVSVNDLNQKDILQNVNVYEVLQTPRAAKQYNSNASVSHGTKRISKGTPVINGTDSLSFWFSKEFGEYYMNNLDNKYLASIDTYTQKFPGIYLETEDPAGNGGRINMFDLQLGFDSDYYELTGNYARLVFYAEDLWDNTKKKYVNKDTVVYYYFSPSKIYNVDSLLTHSGTGSFPEHCLNLTSQEKTEVNKGKAGDRILIEGGGGIKPKFSARVLRDMAMKTIKDTLEARGMNLADTAEVMINKATLMLPFEFPDDYKTMHRFPVVLSPTTRMHYTDTTFNTKTREVQYCGLSDASNSNENQGDINRSTLCYSPDITFHLQALLRLDPKKLEGGDYDVWLLLMAYETTTTTTGTSSEMSDLYTALAYQNYYNSIYGGYGGYGYGGYGYGGYGYGDPYSNYTSYMLASMYANQSSTSTSTDLTLDRDRYYRAYLNGPSNSGRKPELRLTFSIPKK